MFPQTNENGNIDGWRHNPENSHLHIYSRENVKSYKTGNAA
jgi:hypothetical protein